MKSYYFAANCKGDDKIEIDFTITSFAKFALETYIVDKLDHRLNYAMQKGEQTVNELVVVLMSLTTYYIVAVMQIFIRVLVRLHCISLIRCINHHLQIVVHTFRNFTAQIAALRPGLSNIRH